MSENHEIISSEELNSERIKQTEENVFTRPISNKLEVKSNRSEPVENDIVQSENEREHTSPIKCKFDNPDSISSRNDNTCMSYRVDTVSNISFISAMNRYTADNNHGDATDRSYLMSDISAINMKGIKIRSNYSDNSDTSNDSKPGQILIQEPADVGIKAGKWAN